MDASTPGLFCALLLYSLLFVTVSDSQKCVPRAIPDTVIDITQAVALGARFTDPLSVPNEEECLSACCMQRDKGGDQDCNLLVFDGRKGPGLQNCYIFHCPTEDSCPLSPRVGVSSYSFWSEPSSPGKQHAKSGTADNRKPSAVIASQGSAKHSTKDEASDSSKSIASKLLHLADKIDQHLEKMESQGSLQVHYPSPTTATVPATRTTATPIHREGKKVPSDAKVAKPSRVTDKKPNPTGTVPGRTSPRIRTSTPRPVAPADSQDVSVAKKVPVKSAKLPGSSHGALVTPKPLPHTEGPALTTVRQTRAPKMVTHPAPVRTSLWKGTDKPSTSDQSEVPETLPPAQEQPAVSLEEVPRKVKSAGSGGALSSLEDKSGLVAALIFGVLFLLLVIGLVSRKVSEARRRHRYTKLDYLINGMYVDT